MAATNIDALDAFADMLEPASELLADTDIMAELKKGKDGLKSAIKKAVRNHKAALIQLMAAYSGETYEQFRKKMTPLTLPIVAMRMINEPEIQELFFGQGKEKRGESASTIASEATQATETE